MKDFAAFISRYDSNNGQQELIRQDLEVQIIGWKLRIHFRKLWVYKSKFSALYSFVYFIYKAFKFVPLSAIKKLMVSLITKIFNFRL